MEAINAQGILEHVDVLNRFMSNFLDSTGILTCVSDQKVRRTQKPLVKSSTNAQEGLQNLDNSTQSVAPQVCTSQEPKVKPALQHAATASCPSDKV